jgi:hypothetical protein
MRLLVVAEHTELVETLAVGLRRHHVAVEVAFDGPCGLCSAGCGKPSVASAQARPVIVSSR